MRINSTLADDAVLAELGERLSRVRLNRNLTQQQIADEAGVGRRQVQSIERGDPVTTPILIRVLRALDLLDAIDALIPAPAPSPVELIKLHGRARQRATGSRTAGKQDDPAKPWRWGDE